VKKVGQEMQDYLERDSTVRRNALEKTIQQFREREVAK
jgi:hypothetical protein